MQHDSLFSHVLQFINSQDYLLFFILKGKEIKSRSQTRNICCPVLIPERMRVGGQVAFIQSQSQQLVKIAAGEFCSSLIGSTSLAAGANLILTAEQNCLQAVGKMCYIALESLKIQDYKRSQNSIVKLSKSISASIISPN